MTLEEALASKSAHAISRWLGDQEGEPDPVPDVVTVALPPGEGLLLCSDGFWNYAQDPTHIAPLMNGADALAICRALVEFANRQGGADNVTVALYARGELGEDMAEPK
jgi:serine/threonine protein phosphatase PrpC